jgi:hypothetical protein
MKKFNFNWAIPLLFMLVFYLIMEITAFLF